MPSRTVAVIGAGNIGSTLARKWVGAGHRVMLGVRDPAGPRASGLVHELGGAVSATSIAEAAATGGVVAFAIPGNAMAATLEGLRRPLRGKVVIDATGPAHSLALIAKAAPTASGLYRAFNSLGWEILADPVVGGTVADMFFAGPDGAGRATVAGLIADVGLRPIWLGGLERADLADALGVLWFALVSDQSRGRRVALKMLGA